MKKSARWILGTIEYGEDGELTKLGSNEDDGWERHREEEDESELSSKGEESRKEPPKERRRELTDSWGVMADFWEPLGADI